MKNRIVIRNINVTANKIEIDYTNEPTTVIFRRKMNNQSEETKFESVGLNTGNMIFTDALEKEIDLDIVSVEECRGKTPEHIITTDLIWINPQSDFKYLIDQMNTFKDSIYVPISVGLQAKDTNSDFKLSDTTLRVLQMIQERAVIGCRGEYTASVLEKNGIHNIDVIGCPSVYVNLSKGYKFPTTLNNKNNVMCNFRTFYGQLSKREKHFLSYCATRNYDFVEQTKYDLTLENTGCDQHYFEYVNKWLTSKSRKFFDVDMWSNFAKSHEFCMGSRFHGNIVAIWNNVPALFMPIDSRTQELIDFFDFPYIRMEDFDPEKPIEYYFEKADYSEFTKTYSDKFNNFVNFLNKNGLTITESR